MSKAYFLSQKERAKRLTGHLSQKSHVGSRQSLVVHGIDQVPSTKLFIIKTGTGSASSYYSHKRWDPWPARKWSNRTQNLRIQLHYSKPLYLKTLWTIRKSRTLQTRGSWLLRGNKQWNRTTLTKQVYIAHKSCSLLGFTTDIIWNSLTWCKCISPSGTGTWRKLLW